jgi:hypothetical protein
MTRRNSMRIISATGTSFCQPFTAS